MIPYRFRQRHLAIVAFLFSFAAARSDAQTLTVDPPNTHAPMGMNLAGVHDWSPEWPFVDCFKTARPWIPQLASGGPWSTGAPLALTPEGWPILAPGQAAGTLIFRDQQGLYPAGQYLCLYDGTGQITFGFDAATVSSQPGQITINVTPGNGGIYLKIIASDPNNPVRNIRVLMPGFTAQNGAEVFHPGYLDRIRHYKVLRFMDWQQTNDSQLANWADRTTPSTFTQAAANGVALEHMIDLANRLDADPWFSMPHQATDDFVQNFATMVLQQLEPERKVYVEYSNEVWNGIFSQASYAQSMGLALGLSTNAFQAQLRFQSQRSVQMFQIWHQVFAGQTDRIVRVMASQSANSWTAGQVLGWQNAAASVDALAIAPYFGGILGTTGQAPTTLTLNVAGVLAACQQDILTVEGHILSNKSVANAAGVDLIAYEGGQHLVGVGSYQSNATLTQLFIDANRDPAMYALYRDYHARWFNAGGGMFCSFSSAFRPGIYGSWGVVEWQDQPDSSAHKFRAIRDEIRDRSIVAEIDAGPGDLSLGTIGRPTIGNASFRLVGDGADPLSTWTFIVGTQTQFSSIGALPLDLSPYGMTGRSLVVADELFLPAASGVSGQASITASIPNDPSIVGLEYFVQGFAPVTGATPIGFSASNALRIRLVLP